MMMQKEKTVGKAKIPCNGNDYGSAMCDLSDLSSDH